MDDSSAPVNDEVRAIANGARQLLSRYQEREHILRAVLRAIDKFDSFSTLMRSSESRDSARERLIDLLDIDDIQARAVMDIQMLMLPGREHQQMVNDYEDLTKTIADLVSLLASPERQQELQGTDRGRYLAQLGGGMA